MKRGHLFHKNKETFDIIYHDVFTNQDVTSVEDISGVFYPNTPGLDQVFGVPIPNTQGGYDFRVLLETPNTTIRETQRVKRVSDGSEYEIVGIIEFSDAMHLLVRDTGIK